MPATRCILYWIRYIVSNINILLQNKYNCKKYKAEPFQLKGLLFMPLLNNVVKVI